jgi:hypothetical protein
MWFKRKPKDALAVRSEVLSPLDSVPFIFWSVPATRVRAFRWLTGAGLASAVAWLLSQFFQLRGVVNLLLSRLALTGVGICVFFFACMFIQSIGYRFLIAVFAIIALAIVDEFTPKPQAEIKSTPNNTAALQDIPIYLECQWIQYPIAIPPESSIHLLPLQSDLLRIGQSSFGSVGPFQDVRADVITRNFPSPGRDGQWLSKDQQFQIMAAPSGFRCELSNLSSTTVEDVVLNMFVRPSVIGGPEEQKKNKAVQRIPLPFDPMEAAGHFLFYAINYCPARLEVDWPQEISVHPLGEAGSRNVPLKLRKRGWPSELMLFEPSPFKWDSAGNCDWHWFY